MIIYLFSLPIWNFVLPTYAFWHFDDFSWGETRKVQGEGKGGGHGDGDGEFDSTKIVMKRWCDFEAEKRRKTRAILHETPELMSAAIGLAGSQRHSMRKQSYSGMASPLTGPPSESSRHGLDSSTTDQGSLTSGGNNTDSAVLHQPTAVIQSDVAQLQAIAGDERRMSRAADNLEKLGYMTPHIIPALATGTPPRTSSTNLAGMNGNSQRMSVYSAHQYPFLQSSPGFQQQSMPPPPPPIPSMSLGGSSTGSQHQGSTINSMRRSISGQSVPSALEERRRTKY
ncbi:hypothetical protein EV182_004085 [Spiromyces aspiralis]|uniref:Uncharacterized protein n=1 Tax=Spiromyces aspiralis TaxID=68401 RepID=A0ACC1HPI3_9FUNG|nr:hypothetical protein EV182_004085 [Spiromyces aspiralis]